MNLILVRHGESQWNKENRFTGWTDVSLTKNGINEAYFAANQIKKLNLRFDNVYTSILKRAKETANIICSELGFPESEIKEDWRLNERHYGALQGLNKKETAKKYSEERVLLWRRSYSTCPPKLSKNDKRHPKFNPLFNFIANLPSGESLENVEERLKPFLKFFFEEVVSYGENHMIIAHSNSLRSIVKVLENLGNNEIVSLNIPTCVPILYQLDSKFKIQKKVFLLDKKELKTKIEDIENQGKIK